MQAGIADIPEVLAIMGAIHRNAGDPVDECGKECCPRADGIYRSNMRSGLIEDAAARGLNIRPIRTTGDDDKRGAE